MIRFDLAHDAGTRLKLFETASNIRLLESQLRLGEDPIFAMRMIPYSNYVEFGVSKDHVVNVAALSGRLCEAFVDDPLAVAEVRIAAMFHDIGKIAVPVEILEKPESLTEEERRIVMNHVILGKEILSQGKTNSLKLAAQVAYCHHERWDGNGYPDRVGADKIPFAARVVAIADVYDAITSERTYHRALGHDEAIQKMTTEMSTHFDPALLKMFCALFPDADSIFATTNSFRGLLSIRNAISTLEDEYQ